ncbi:Dihydrolipoyllysine-residue acetyltransferase component of pyruvate dehydrogenase complex [Candidatus Rhabdochlamydia oedothoracis]|uniref:Dihydrolipoamide acetyltransferase component of pyruvate dehydrogenase complex n=1 Tax=Candidatus Rhabdochlamydia oedothoracis TaxID=2720720 RepID=A0ABX8V2E5_9BACT|nr:MULTISPECIES: dihydrolipoamide acetyltransferase family protein [Rhabdochlamydia]KAG6558916.1 Dihydrolipoyllysine-residue acetyltransferase component of pyruvate dehydrogenase complex [Candidatus Rhabdochlamydia sp. W815]MCL6756377.1 2-oxo acid dehydrogenase subunit E2 [Candidatus Rhabdochlamydia oedothoracis]QYF49383.1 Dihydrolipoyllysine-residue acetyltransferase component of pyruvate dehydrogenase complex [Candidatus Rhabdochlamydia oedothoracis]
MSGEIKVLLPKLGESIHSAVILQWFKKVGDVVQLDEPLLEVSTDKLSSEIPSPIAGILQEICAEVDQEVQIGDLLAIISTEDRQTNKNLEKNNPSPISINAKRNQYFFSPALLRLAREHKLNLEELQKITGTGSGGRVTKQDLELYLEKRTVKEKGSLQSIERLQMTGMRKAIADNMVRSFYEAPHATLITEIDITNVVQCIQKEKQIFLEKCQAKLTLTSFIARALIKALQEFPLLNSSLDKDTILMKRFINLGIAVSVKQGLLVPVLKGAQDLSLPKIAQGISALSHKARMGKLVPDDVTEGTITITNFGMSGVQIGIPIIRYPEVAIIGVGASYRKVIPREDDSLAICSMINLSLTFDHRVLDGMYGCAFLNALKHHLETDKEL